MELCNVKSASNNKYITYITRKIQFINGLLFIDMYP